MQLQDTPPVHDDSTLAFVILLPEGESCNIAVSAKSRAHQYYYYVQGLGNAYHANCLAGYYLCSNDVQIGKPQDKADLASMVGHFSHVKGVGVGHSWWGPQFCSGNSSDAINIVTTELNSTLEM